MKRRTALVLAISALCVAPVFAQPAHQASPRIGVLLFGTPEDDTNFHAFRQGLQQLGYLEGRNISFVYRFAHGRAERLRDLAVELVATEPDAIVAIGGDVAPYARAATATIPIVMVVSNDPAQAGLVASLARPGGNVTGVSLLSSELAAKRLQILKQIAPQLSRVAVVWNPDHVDPEYREMQLVAQRLGMQVVSLEVRSAGDFDGALSAALDAGVQAIVPVSSRLIAAQRERLLKFAADKRLPLASGWGPWAKEGAVFSYGPDLSAASSRAALHLDKILKGAKPGDLPVERPTRFELIINAKAANTLGLSVPATLLLSADRVIE